MKSRGLENQKIGAHRRKNSDSSSNKSRSRSRDKKSKVDDGQGHLYLRKFEPTEKKLGEI